MQPENGNGVSQLGSDRLAALIAKSSRYIQTGSDSEGRPVFIRYCILGLQEQQQEHQCAPRIIEFAPNS
jgi:hypothetical protein